MNKINNAEQYRAMCWLCRQPEVGCYCHLVEPFDPGCDFVILIHPRESRRRIATGRMAHRLLKHSHLLEGEIFDDHPELTRLLSDPQRKNFVLYPDEKAIDLESCSDEELRPFSDSKQRPTIFLIDGTWATARKTMRSSYQLSNLVRVKFTPQVRSRFQAVRKQPAPECVSTIEAIHEFLERLNSREQTRQALLRGREHDRLLQTFSFMVRRQEQFSPASTQV